jgi:hypothetical protein
MYDFFAFSFPGTCIIISILFIYDDGEWVYQQLPEFINFNSWHSHLALALLGYIVGYIIRPIARYFLLINLAIFFWGYLWPTIKYLITFFLNNPKKKWINEVRKHQKLRRCLLKKNYSDSFVKIRELTEKNALFIEFWDMHISMSHNLAFAIIVFTVVQIVNYYTFSYQLFTNNFTIVLIVITIIVFFTLLHLSIFYAFWWMNDIDASTKFISDKELMLEEVKKNINK